MADDEKITRVAWCDEAEAAFRSHPDTADDLEEIRIQVTRDDAQLWRFTGPAEIWLVTRLERYPSGRKELVLVNAAGRNCRLGLDVCDKMAEYAGADGLRAHVRSRALMRILEARGWEPDRTVYVKALNHV